MINVIGKVDKNKKYPLAYKDDSSDMVVMFIEDKCGYVVIGNDAYSPGYYTEDWPNCRITSEWIPVNIEITH